MNAKDPSRGGVWRRRVAIAAVIGGLIAVPMGGAYMSKQSRGDEKPRASPRSSNDEATRAEVEKAYLLFWREWEAANLELDPQRLEDVAIDPALQELASQIDIQKASAQPVRVKVEHDYRIVLSTDGDLGVTAAYVEDRYLNHTVRLDAHTYEPIESDPNELIDATFVLEKVGGFWMVAEIIERG